MEKNNGKIFHPGQQKFQRSEGKNNKGFWPSCRKCQLFFMCENSLLGPPFTLRNKIPSIKDKTESFSLCRKESLYGLIIIASSSDIRELEKRYIKLQKLCVCTFPLICFVFFFQKKNVFSQNYLK